MSKVIELTLIGKPGCHLCEDAESVVNQVLAEFDGLVTLTHRDILEDSELFAQYSEQVPVLLLNGKVHNYWRINQERLREAITKCL